MSIWFVLWLVLSAALLYFLGWTLYILYRQKQGWKKYAAARKLRYNAASMLASPEMSGIIDGYTTSFFTSEHASADGRTVRKLTAIEVNLSSRMPFEGSVGSGGMVPLVRTMGLKEEISPPHKDWDQSWIAGANNRAALESYLTPERLEALVSLMKLKSGWVVFIFRDDAMLLRLDTPDPLDEPKKIDLLIRKMIDTARKLELKDGEGARLKTVKSPPVRRAAVPDSPAGPVSLELEEPHSPEEE